MAHRLVHRNPRRADHVVRPGVPQRRGATRELIRWLLERRRRPECGASIPCALHFRTPVEHAPAAAGRSATAPGAAAEIRSRRRATRGDPPARTLRCRWRRRAPSRAPGTPAPRRPGVLSQRASAGGDAASPALSAIERRTGRPASRCAAGDSGLPSYRYQNQRASCPRTPTAFASRAPARYDARRRRVSIGVRSSYARNARRSGRRGRRGAGVPGARLWSTPTRASG